jgi:hypothetical protein
MRWKDEHIRILKEVVITYLRVLSMYLPEETEKTTKYLSGQLITQDTDTHGLLRGL